MSKTGWALCAALACIASVSLAQQPLPTWAFNSPDEAQPQIDANRDKPMHLDGSDRVYTRAQAEDIKNAPDWFPDSHAPMPAVVAQGSTGNVSACASCHLTSGMGLPGLSSLAGLTIPYMLQQLEDFRSGARSNPIVIDDEPQDNDLQQMIAIARELSEEDSESAVGYFASLTPVPEWVDVVESDTVPKTFVTESYLRLPRPEGGDEPLGSRIVELPRDIERSALRDPRSGTVAYVPVGAIERGRMLATSGIQCAICHGPDLRGVGDAPGIAGHSPTYTFRQLYGFKEGSRSGALAELMKVAVSQLSQEDMIALAAYVATLTP